MIQWMHRLSKSWVASLLMGGLALSFVVWGIADVFTGQQHGALATVGSTEIASDGFRAHLPQFPAQPGPADGHGDHARTWPRKWGWTRRRCSRLISRTALDNVAARLGLTTTDAELAQYVRAMPAFEGATGEFDRNVFLQAIQSAGYNEQSFLDEDARRS